MHIDEGTLRRLSAGELTKSGDLIRVMGHRGAVYYTLKPCKYDKEGLACCVGRPVGHGENIYRQSGNPNG